MLQHALIMIMKVFPCHDKVSTGGDTVVTWCRDILEFRTKELFPCDMHHVHFIAHSKLYQT